MIAGAGVETVYTGVLAALAAALCWTLASVLWRRLPTSLGAAQLNLLKNGLGLVLLLPMALAAGNRVPTEAWVLLALSGVLGIAAGDSLFFAALRRLGTRRTLTVEAAAPVLTTLTGLALLAEWPSGAQLLGLGLVTAAVVLVAHRRADPLVATLPAGQQRQGGLPLALLAMVCASAGAVLARHALAGLGINPWQAAGIRLGAATLVQLPWVPGLLAAVRAPLGPRPHRRRWPLVLAATLLGTSLGIGLQQTALTHLPAGQAVTLMATAPTMAVLLAPLERDRPGVSGLLAALLALLGAWLVAH